MATTLTPARPTDDAGDAPPAWEIAYLYPPQGMWSEHEYLRLPGNRLVEFSDGWVEVLPVPTEAHQLIVAFLHAMLSAWAVANDEGTPLFAPFKVRVRDGKFREPDVMFMRKAHAARRHSQYWEGADLVMEVVSADDPARDWEVKRAEYAGAGIPEYWIIDARTREVTVLKLADGAYAVHGVFGTGRRAESATLAGFGVEVERVFSVG